MYLGSNCSQGLGQVYDCWVLGPKGPYSSQPQVASKSNFKSAPCCLLGFVGNKGICYTGIRKGHILVYSLLASSSP